MGPYGRLGLSFWVGLVREDRRGDVGWCRWIADGIR